MKKIKTFLFAFFAGLLNLNFAMNLQANDNDITDYLNGVDVDEYGIVNELDGLGRIIKAPKFSVSAATSQLEKVKAATAQASARRRQALKNSLTTRGQRNIVSRFNELPPKFQAEVKQNTVKFRDVTMYVVSEESSIGGIVEMVDSKTILSPGRSSLEQNGEVPAGVALSVNYISLQNNIFDPATQTFFSMILNRPNNPIILGSDLVIMMDRKVIQSIPISMMRESRKGIYNTDSNSLCGYNLNQEIIIKPGSKLQFQIVSPDGETYAVTDRLIGLKVTLSGDGTVNA